MPVQMSPEEMQAAMAEAVRLQEEDIKQFGYVTESTKNKLNDAKAGIKNYTAQLKASVSQLKSSAASTLSSMAKSADGASQYSSVLKSGANFLANKLSSRGPLGIAGGQLLKLGVDYSVAVAKQADDLYKSYQQTSRAGVIGVGGITELYSTMQKFGYGIEELDNLSAILKANSTSLALLRGTAIDGAQAFGDLSKAIRDSELGVKLQNMGVSVDTMNTGIAGYLKLEQQTGMGQLKTSEQLRAGAESYLVEQEKLAKITGMSADVQQQAREAALSEQRFGAHITDLKLKAAQAEASGDLENAKRLRDQAERDQRINLNLQAAGNSTMAQGFRNVASGYLNDKNALQFQNALPNAVEAIRSIADESTVMNTISRDAGKISKESIELQKAGAAGIIYGDMAEYRRVSNLEDFNKRVARAAEQLEVTDESTDSMTQLGIKQRKTRDDLQDLKQVGIRPVTAAFEGLAKAIEAIPGVASTVAKKATGGAGGTVAPPGTSPRPSGKPGTPGANTGIPTEGAPPAPKAKESGGWLRDLLGLSKPTTATTTPGSIGSIRELIAQAESKGDYNVLWGGKTANLTQMTISEVLGLQEQMIQSGAKSTAAGKYQFIRGTLSGLVSKLRLDPQTTKFDQSTQDALADASIRARGYDDYVSGKLTKEEFLRNLSKEWAGLPSDVSGKSYHAGDGLNKANVDWTTAMASLRDGGVASGPRNGYQAMLHGTEAVVPLPDGKSIPVEQATFDDVISNRISLYSQQLDKFQTLMTAMQKHVDISNKILQRAQ